MQSILYICVHNAGRSQMAEALTNKLARERGVPVRALSAGTAAGDRIDPVALDAMREIGVPMGDQRPKRLTQQMVDGADHVITMGCGVDVAACPARFLVTEDWGLDDPAGQPIETVRAIRDQIRERVSVLLDEIAATEAGAREDAGG